MLITDQPSLESFCRSLQGAEYITVDTEFLREKTYYPKLCLIQISGPDKNAAAIDPLAEGLDLAPVFDLLLDPGVLKVLHAGRQDLEIFFQLTGKVVQPLFDTQIAAMVCGYGESSGYEALVRAICGHGLDKASQFTDWSRRPLSTRQIDYALGDVIHLVDVYKKLSERLKAKGREHWVFEEEQIMLDPATYHANPDDAWKRIKIRSPKPKTLAVLKALAAWREIRAKERNQPRNWIMRDETLADLAGQLPKSTTELERIRGFPKDLAQGAIGDIVLRTIQSTLDSDPAHWPKPERKTGLSPQQTATADMLRLLLRVTGASEDVAAKMIAGSDDIEKLAAEDNPDISAMQGWRHEIFGCHAAALKAGKIAIGLKDGKIAFFDTSAQTEIKQ